MNQSTKAKPKNMIFRIQRTDRGEIHVVSLNGYMGNSECAQLEDELDQLLEAKHPLVVVDLAGLTFATSAGFDRLERYRRRFRRQDGEFTLAGLPAQFRELAALGGLPDPHDMEGSVFRAIRSLKRLQEAKQLESRRVRPSRSGGTSQR